MSAHDPTTWPDAAIMCTVVASVAWVTVAWFRRNRL
jgi:hypothetical protein